MVICFVELLRGLRKTTFVTISPFLFVVGELGICLLFMGFRVYIYRKDKIKEKRRCMVGVNLEVCVNGVG